MLRSEQKKIVKAAMMQTARNPWDRWDKEPGIAYDRFLMYREMGVKRSIHALAKLLGINWTGVRRMAMQWEWEIRVAAWDEKLAKTRDDAAITEARRMGERHAQLGMSMQQIAGKRLGQFTESEELISSLSADETIRLAKEGAALERTARGEDPDKGKSGNIIFNINLGGSGDRGLPRWAPKGLVVEGEKVDRDQAQEGTAPPAADIHR